jgi:hypothetical protein
MMIGSDLVLVLVQLHQGLAFEWPELTLSPLVKLLLSQCRRNGRVRRAPFCENE